jgi:hypothetical protein
MHIQPHSLPLLFTVTRPHCTDSRHFRIQKCPLARTFRAKILVNEERSLRMVFALALQLVRHLYAYTCPLCLFAASLPRIILLSKARENLARNSFSRHV